MHDIDRARRIAATRPPQSGRHRLDASIAAVCERQHGLITLTQLQSLGLSPRAARDRVQAGRLRRIHRGVFALEGCNPGHEQRRLAAVLACGPDALLVDVSAAANWELVRGDGGRTHVAGAGRAGEGITGVVSHRIGGLRAEDLAVHRGIPTTTVARTIFDIAKRLDEHRLRRAIDRAEIRHRFDARELHALLKRHPATPGAPRLRAVLAAYAEPGVTRSGLEDLLFAALDAAGVPCPRTNGWIALDGGGGYSPDFLWPGERLIVEADSRRFHTSPLRRAEDARRDRRLALAGYVVLRFTDLEIERRTAAVVAEIGAALVRSRARQGAAP